MSSQDEVKSNLRILRQQSDPQLLAEIRDAIGPDLNIIWPSGKQENNG
jgi:hypothetical protein